MPVGPSPAGAGRIGLLAFGLAVAVSSVASALPADARLTLAPGADKFLKAPLEVVDVVTEPEGIFTAELMPSGEIFVSVPAKAKGAATLLALGSDLLYAWEICVSGCPAETSLLTAKAACPDLKQVTEDGKQFWTADIKDQKCFDALKSALAHAALRPQDLRLVLEEEVAIAFFRRVSAAVAADPRAKGVTAGYYGATLKLTGEAPRAAVSRAVAHAYLETLGAVSFDDQTSQPGKSK